MDRKIRERKNSDIKPLNNLNHKDWIYIRRISGMIKLKGKRVGDVKK